MQYSGCAGQLSQHSPATAQSMVAANVVSTLCGLLASSRHRSQVHCCHRHYACRITSFILAAVPIHHGLLEDRPASDSIS